MSRKFTVSAFSENTPGVLHRIVDLFTRRKVNIESLTVSETERRGISRFTIVVLEEKDIVQKIVKQINRVIEVVDVFASENNNLVYKEIAFYKVTPSSPEKRAEIEELANRYDANVEFANAEIMVLEKAGSEDDIRSLFRLLEPHGITEFIRSGRIAVAKTKRSPGQLFLNGDKK